MPNDPHSAPAPDDALEAETAEANARLATRPVPAREALARIRARLNDLKLTNPLINFRHTARSVRVVDTRPDVLYQRLRVDGDEMVVLPLPAVEEPKPDAVAIARRLGIRTEYELAPPAAPDAAPASAHAEKAIQTLQFPSDLESLLRKLAADARGAIEETGSNILYLVFGFLEWNTDDPADLPRFAPLLLLPASLRRGEPDPQFATRRFYLSDAGEDVIVNPALQERLRQECAFELPDIAAFELPEAYFARIGALIESRREWRVRRQVTLVMHSLAKLLVYRDLNPKSWPAGRSPAEHPVIRELFEGPRHSDVAASPEYRLEAPEVRAHVPHLVLDADSSQHSAIVDAMQGRNLVIEGPPGTGKSQTIANLIAAAMVAGKSVLFVADKLCALEVVRRRLDDVGLGMFCLELHSHKTQKSSLMDDLRQRLVRWRKVRDAASLDAELGVAESTRASLAAHAEVMNRPFGGLGATPYDILWSFERRRRSIGIDTSPFAALTIEGVERWTREEYRAAGGATQALAQQLATIQASGVEPLRHPWRGVEAAQSDAQTDSNLQRRLRSVLEVGQAIVRDATVLAREAGIEPTLPREGFAKILREVDALSQAPAEIVPELLPAAMVPATHQRLRDLCEAIESKQALRAQLSRALRRAPEELEPEVPALRQVCERALELSLAGANSSALSGVLRTLNAIAQGLAEASGIRERFVRVLGVQVRDDLGELPLIADAVRQARLAPFAALYVRQAANGGRGIESIVREAQGQAMALREERRALEQSFDLSRITAPALLATHRDVCANAGTLRVFSGAYQTARLDWAAIARGDASEAGPEVMAAGFGRLANYVARVTAFDQNPTYRASLGALFRGVETRFEDVSACLGWQSAVAESLGRHGEAGSYVAQALLAAREDALYELAQMLGESAALPEGVQRVAHDLHQLRSQWTVAARAVDAQPLSVQAANMAALARKVLSMATSLERAAVPVDQSIHSLTPMLDAVVQLQEWRTALANDLNVRALLGDAFARAQTAVPEIRATLTLADAIRGIDVPESLRRWLATPAYAERTQALIARLGSVVTGFDQLARVHAQFVATAQLNEATWYGDARPQGERPVAQIIERATRALSAGAQLPAWLEYVAAVRTLGSVGLSGLVALAEKSLVAAGDVVRVADFVIHHSLARAAIASEPALADFSGMRHEEVRDRFRAADARSIELFRERAAHVIDQRQVPPGVRSDTIEQLTEAELLFHEAGKQKQHIPIRQLMKRASGALQALKPCFMMGPRAVAQYLPPGQVAFDLVVIDEASLLRFEDALGAIARGRQLVVVGDPKQLPPTTFSEVLREGSEADASSTVGGASESILDVARAVFQPMRRLRWHYRSRHSSLIAFSSQRFYGDDLAVFPSAVDRDPEFGVQHVAVRDGLSVQGRNAREAERVAQAVVEHFRSRPDETLGVVTLNSRQRELIEDELDRLLIADPALWMQREAMQSGAEPFFVKQLETVQGEERDVIMISLTHGRAEPGGRVPPGFGPISGKDGPRILNVLFTRAKRRVVVFSSFDPEELKLEEIRAGGARALLDYLAFARSGQIPAATARTPAGASDFQRCVADALRARGYAVEPRVGVSGYFVDLAVRHPKRPGCYVLGIETDGAMYQASFSTRDRDRLTPRALEERGWAVHRVWSVDWFKDPEREAARIVRAIEQRLLA